jgi:hypothetical protein
MFLERIAKHGCWPSPGQEAALTMRRSVASAPMTC